MALSLPILLECECEEDLRILSPDADSLTTVCVDGEGADCWLKPKAFRLEKTGDAGRAAEDVLCGVHISQKESQAQRRN